MKVLVTGGAGAHESGLQGGNPYGRRYVQKQLGVCEKSTLKFR